MRIPTIQGLIKRRLLLNYRADPAVVQRLLPTPFRPKLHRGNAVVGICLIRLEQIRPVGLPGAVGLSSENAAHRFAVEWTEPSGAVREGVFIPRRDTGSRLNHLAGGRIFPGEHHPADFSVLDCDQRIELSMRSYDDQATIRVTATEAPDLTEKSCFQSLEDASAFFETGSIGYSVRRTGKRLDGLQLLTSTWRVRPLSVSEVHSSFYSDLKRFPPGSIHFDHGLIMRDVPHRWHAVADLSTEAGAMVSPLS